MSHFRFYDNCSMVSMKHENFLFIIIVLFISNIFRLFGARCKMSLLRNIGTSKN